MEDLKFCFSQNLSYFFRSRYSIDIDNWLLYLSMNPIGFSYWGMSEDNTVLNGLDSHLDDYIARAEECFRFKRYNVKHSFADEKIWLSSHIIQTEDYYLPYHPSYQVNYCQRFIVTAGLTNQGYRIFDKELYLINLRDLERTASSVFLFTKPDMKNKENIQEKIMIKFLQEKQMYSESSKEALQRFWIDFCHNQDHWSPQNYNSLYFFITNLAGPRSVFKAHSLALYQLAERFNNIDTDACIYLRKKAQVCGKMSEEWNIIGALCFKYSQLNKPKTLTSIRIRLEEVIKVLNKL